MFPIWWMSKIFEILCKQYTKIILCVVRFSPNEVRLNQASKHLENSENWIFKSVGVFSIFWCLVQSGIYTSPNWFFTLRYYIFGTHSSSFIPSPIPALWIYHNTGLILKVVCKVLHKFVHDSNLKLVVQHFKLVNVVVYQWQPTNVMTYLYKLFTFYFIFIGSVFFFWVSIGNHAAFERYFESYLTQRKQQHMYTLENKWALCNRVIL